MPIRVFDRFSLRFWCYVILFIDNIHMMMPIVVLIITIIVLPFRHAKYSVRIVDLTRWIRLEDVWLGLKEQIVGKRVQIFVDLLQYLYWTSHSYRNNLKRWLPKGVLDKRNANTKNEGKDKKISYFFPIRNYLNYVIVVCVPPILFLFIFESSICKKIT